MRFKNAQSNLTISELKMTLTLHTTGFYRMNEGLFYSVPLSNEMISKTNNNEVLKDEKTADLRSQVRKYFPETWIWSEKVAE